jgi:hypothetical protein
MLTERAELRKFLFEDGDANYALIGEYLNQNLFNMTYTVCGILIDFRLRNKAEKGYVDETVMQEMANFLYKNVLDIHQLSSYENVIAGLNRIKVKYNSLNDVEESAFSKAFALVKTGANVIKNNAQKIQQNVSSVIWVVMTIASLSAIIKTYFSEKVKQLNRIKTKKELERLYINTILPEVNNMVKLSADGTIKSTTILKGHMFEMIDRISQKEPVLAPYISGWGAML